MAAILHHQWKEFMNVVNSGQILQEPLSKLQIDTFNLSLTEMTATLKMKLDECCLLLGKLYCIHQEIDKVEICFN